MGKNVIEHSIKLCYFLNELCQGQENISKYDNEIIFPSWNLNYRSNDTSSQRSSSNILAMKYTIL